MRVLLFTEHVALSTFWVNTARVLLARGVDVTFATLRGHEPAHAMIAAGGGRAYALGAKTARDYPMAAARLLRLLQSQRIDVLHTAEIISASVAGLIPRSAYDCRRVFRWGGSFEVWKRNQDRLGPRLFAFSQRRADLVMASSESAAREAQQKGRVCSERIRVVHNGVETPRHISEIDLSRLRSELEVPAHAAVISVVARLRPEKGIDVLIDAIPRVERLVQRPVALVVVGDGTEAGHLRTKASRSDAGQILFVGAKSDVSPWFRVADVVAVPSLFEPFGLSALEAVACQRPIVASSVGGLPEFISHGKTGILVPPGDSGALSEALADMLIDQKRAENMATAGYRLYCERFTTDAMVEKWLECYGEMLRQGVAH